MPSKNLKKIHQELCPEIPIDSIEFTYKLIEEITRLKEGLRGKIDEQSCFQDVIE